MYLVDNIQCEDLQGVLEALGGCVLHHSHLRLSGCPGTEMAYHRVVYMGIAGIYTQLLQNLVPLQNVSTFVRYI